MDFGSRSVVLYEVIAYICHSFVPSGFPIGSAKLRMKRESGESPGQSRCCEALFKTHRQSVCHWLQHREGVDARVSQKTCHRFFIINRTRGKDG